MTTVRIPDDDSTLRLALNDANIPTLMMVIMQLTGDYSMLDGEIRPARDAMIFGEGTRAMTEEQMAEIRERAFIELKAFRGAGRELPPIPDAQTLSRMLTFCMGEEVSEEYVPLVMDEMDLAGTSGKGTVLPTDVTQDFRVLIIGAGISGLCAAIQLEQMGIPYTLIEKNDTVGGTWYENTYPECGVDTPNHFYSYSFEPNHDWSSFYSKRDELYHYLKHCVDKYGVRPHIRFRTEVEACRYDEVAAVWHVQVGQADGRRETLTANVVISGVGQLNRPKTPAFVGAESFQGVAFHSARWEHNHDLNGKRIVVIGTGASAMQFVRSTAERAKHLTIFQRSAHWALHNPYYHREVTEGKKWLLKHVPYYAKWHRFRLFWASGDGLHASLFTDPDWPHPDRAMNATNDHHRDLFTRYIVDQLGDHTELIEQVVPDYPPFGKRMLIDNDWYRTLTRDDVTLIAEEVSHIVEDGVVSASGEHLPADVIIYATGFHPNKFLWPMHIVGQGGKVLSEVWGDDPRAYLGLTVPNFPNLFCLYGPNTNLAHGGSIIFHAECQVRYIMKCLTGMIERGIKTMTCRPDVHDAYNADVDAAHEQMVWTHEGMNNWYKNDAGRVTSVSPWRLVDYWRMTHEPDFNDFILTD